MVIDLQHYLAFLETHKGAMQRIARHSQEESLLEDVQIEIWLVAEELSSKRPDPIDFLNPEHQELLIAHTYQKLVRYSETNVRYAVRMDNTHTEGDRLDYANRLTNGNIEDPLNCIVIESDRSTETLECHSLGAAWVSVLDNCNNKMSSVAYFLKISLGHSYRCFNQALYTARVQYPLPLYIPDNAASNLRPWRPYRRYREPEQLAFAFDEELPLQ